MKGGENKLDGEDRTHAWEHSVQYAQRQNQNNPNPCPPPPAAMGSKDPRVWRDRTRAEGSQGARATGPGDSEGSHLAGILALAATNFVTYGFLNRPIAPWHGAGTVGPHVVPPSPPWPYLGGFSTAPGTVRSSTSCGQDGESGGLLHSYIWKWPKLSLE